ncbi:MAG: hypothetical protein A2X86_21840 [Bdellovibrionales bacterium GWA2_49_15]|nr:MAG: hypothetical protein A2X86_21840 [Bdellovibrionales bacterium GWA2_49_15]HAZ12857.1 hypothetical protein [Bdellovibrionales bacterium]
MRRSKKYLMIFVLLLGQHQVQAAITCTGSSVTADYSIRSGSGSLHSMRVQDQDGLGTCYANALSLALEANLGTPVSAQQLAVLYGVNRNSTSGNAVTERYADGMVKKNFAEGGFTCDTFNIVKARTPNYLCSRANVPIENLARPSGQREIMNAMAQFYDRFNQFKSSSPDEARAFSSTIRNIYSTQQTVVTQRCLAMAAEAGSGSAVGSALQEQLGSYCVDQYDKYKSYLEAAEQLRTRLAAIPNNSAHAAERTEVAAYLAHAEENGRIAKQKIQSIGSVLDDADLDGRPDSPIAPGEIVFNTCAIRPPVLSQINSQYLPAVARTFANGDGQRPGATMMGSSTSPGPLRSFLSTTGLFPSITNAPTFPNEIFNNPSGSPMSEAEIQAQLRQDIYRVVPSLCRRNQAWTDMKDSTTFRQAYYRARRMCLGSELGDAVSELFSGLGVLTAGSLPTDAIIQSLTQVDRPLSEYFLGAISPDCLADSSVTPHPGRIQIPSTMSCNKMDFPAYINDHLDRAELLRRLGRRGTRNPNALAITRQYQREEGARHLRNMVDGQLHQGNGNPVMLDFCTAFLRDSSADSNFGDQAACGTAGQTHAFHALNVVGHRCRNGKTEYQLQNSWGQGCGSYVRPPAGTAATVDPDLNRATGTPIYECDAANGNVWVPEDVVVRNMRGAQYLSR